MNDKANSDPLIDISHESLIRQWDSLREWVDKEAESRAIYLRLAGAATLYEERQEGLYRNPALEVTLLWRDKAKPTKVWGQRYHPEFDSAMRYLDKSQRRQRYRMASYVLLAVLLIGGAMAALVYGQKILHMNEVLAQKKVAEDKTKDAQDALQAKTEAEAATKKALQDKLDAEAAAKEELKQQLAKTQKQTELAKEAQGTAERALADKTAAQEKFKHDVQSYVIANEEYKAKLETQLKETEKARLSEVQARQNAEDERQKAVKQTLIAEEETRKAVASKLEAEAALRAKGEADARAAKETQRANEEARLRDQLRVAGETIQKGGIATVTIPMLGTLQYHRLPNGYLEILGDWVRQNIETVNVPELKEIPNGGKPLTGDMKFYKGAAAQLQAAFKEIKERGLLNQILTWDAGYTPLSSPSYQFSTALTGHPLGIAFDINRKENPDGSKPLPAGQKGSVRELVPIFEKYGFEWWGNRSPFPVGEHFEVIKIVNPASVTSLPGSSQIRRILNPKFFPAVKKPDAAADASLDLQCTDVSP